METVLTLHYVGFFAMCVAFGSSLMAKNPLAALASLVAIIKFYEDIL